MDPGEQQNEGPKAASLALPRPSIGYTFALAGFLKILTMSTLLQSAPAGAIRSAAGEASQYLLVPGALLMAWVAKQIVDRGLQESPRFLAGLAGVCLCLYLGLYKVLYRYDPAAYVNNLPPAKAPARSHQGRQDAVDKERWQREQEEMEAAANGGKGGRKRGGGMSRKGGPAIPSDADVALMAQQIDGGALGGGRSRRVGERKPPHMRIEEERTFRELMQRR